MSDKPPRESSLYVVEQWAAAIVRVDFPAASALLAPHAIVQVKPTNEPVIGSEAYLAFLNRWLMAFPDLRLSTSGVTVSATRPHAFRVDTHFTGTHAGPFHTGVGVVTPTQRPVELLSSNELVVDDGRIVEIYVYLNLPKLLAQLGIPFPIATEKGLA